MYQFNQNTAVKTAKAVANNIATQHAGVVFEDEYEGL